MKSALIYRGRTRRDCNQITSEHYYRVDVFYHVIDTQLGEIQDRFPEQSCLSLPRIALFNPVLLVQQENVKELMFLVAMYSSDFIENDLNNLEQQLPSFILYLNTNPFIHGIQSLSAAWLI